MIDPNLESSGHVASAINQVRPASIHRILVVEDDLDIRQLCVGALINSGYQVDSAEDGAAGWQALQANRYDLLITDHDMPRVSGVELVRMLRNACKDLAVVLASGAIPSVAISRHSSLQLSATLQKPFSIGELLDIVENVLDEVENARDSLPVPSGNRSW